MTRIKPEQTDAGEEQLLVPSAWRYEELTEPAGKGRWVTLKKYWLKFGELLGMVFGTVLLSIVYLTVVGIGWVWAAIMRVDLLRTQEVPGGGFWRDRAQEPSTIQTAKRTF